MDDVTQRVRRVAERILENESLTADLDDEAAQALLDWGLDWGEKIARNTADLEDTAAEELMSPKLRALRRLMRTVNRWLGAQQEADAEQRASYLANITAHAATIHGGEFTPPDEDHCQDFLMRQAELADQPSVVIANLRLLLEDSVLTAGGGDDQATHRQEGELELVEEAEPVYVEQADLYPVQEESLDLVEGVDTESADPP